MANQKFIKALNREPQSCPPVWFMRQAGRYHQLYQKKRARYSFMEMCKNPQLAAEVALDPIRDFDFDVSIMFSDLLFPLEALGFGLDYALGPQLGTLLRWDNLDQLKSVDEAFPALEFQGEVLKLTREMLPEDKSLIGFVGGL
ncbi:MAG: uroporphyrinogen decarboxylase, partial [Gammaproteobacteria bacterium]|nr:uroporphyrinogen decarboxylase [Gammaproteobacteria bacterium]